MDGTDNQVLVIFGASGDLTKRKLIPAVYDLFCRKYLPEKYALIGIGRTEYDDESFRKQVVHENEHLKKKSSKNETEQFSEMVHYQTMQTSDPSAYDLLKKKLKEISGDWEQPGNVIFYLSTPPKLYGPIAENLSRAGLSDENDGWKRLIIEKPFGYDLATAKSLNTRIHDHFFEDQIFRIDHYLGKETVQNLMVTRFANSIYEPLWNRNYIHRVEITSAESVGVEKRGGYYEGAGALRDMVQNHLMQLVSLVAMEPPSRIDANAIRNEKLKIFQSIRRMTDEDIARDVIRGQYMASNIKGQKVTGYREEKGVDPDSRTETFVALKFFVDNWRWADVPFYIRTGKRLPERVSEVVIHFKPNHHRLFNQNRLVNNQNMMVFRIQPDEGVQLKFGLKVPGAGFNVETVNMTFQYDELTDQYVPDAYERLLLDCMQGDATLYARGDSVEAAWEFIDPILRTWESNKKIPIYGYPAGTWGPDHVDQLIDGQNMAWRYPCANLTDDENFCVL